ncbi:hypothetical protein D3C73_862400 [compost metagenome]
MAIDEQGGGRGHARLDVGHAGQGGDGVFMLQLGAVDLALGGVAGDLDLKGLGAAEQPFLLHAPSVVQVQVEPVAGLQRDLQRLGRQHLAEIGAS